MGDPLGPPATGHAVATGRHAPAPWLLRLSAGSDLSGLGALCLETSLTGPSLRFARIYDETLVTNIAFTQVAFGSGVLRACGGPFNARRCGTARCARLQRRRARRRRTGPIRACLPLLPLHPRLRLLRSPPGSRGAR